MNVQLLLKKKKSISQFTSMIFRWFRGEISIVCSLWRCLFVDKTNTLHNNQFQWRMTIYADIVERECLVLLSKSIVYKQNVIIVYPLPTPSIVKYLRQILEFLVIANGIRYNRPIVQNIFHNLHLLSHVSPMHSEIHRITKRFHF